MITRCLNCGAILCEPGQRSRLQQAAHFDSTLPTIPSFGSNTSWARCAACYQVAQIMAEINRRLEMK